MHIGYSYDDEFVNLYNETKDKLLQLEGISKCQLDINEFSRKFFKSANVSDASVDSNANVNHKTVISYKSEAHKPADKLNSLYLLWKQLKETYDTTTANAAIQAELNGLIYINDLTGINFPYCYNFSTMDIASMGLPFLDIKVDRPKNLSSFMGQMVTFSSYASNSVMGAVGLADLLIVASWYYEKLIKDNVSSGQFIDEDKATLNAKKQLVQELQGFIYNCNMPFRGGLQSGFYNVSVYDDAFLENLVPGYVFEDGTSPKIETVKSVQIIYLDLMNDILSKTPITFPVATANFAVDDSRELNKEFLDTVCEKNLQYGFLNIYSGKSSTLSSCCRLRSNNDDKQFFNLFGSGSTKIGSLGVVTINLPRILFESPGNWETETRLHYAVDLALKINHAKRSIIQKNIDAGMLPLYTHYFMQVNTQYSTIGLVGINEAIGYSGNMITRKSGQELVDKILDTITLETEFWQKSHNYPVNIEQVPGENSSVKLAEKDAYYFKGNKKFNPCKFYSNQFIPLIEDADVLDRIRIQGRFDSKLSGGAIVHLNIAEPVTDKEIDKDLVEFTVKAGVIYFAENRNLQRCEDKHMSVGLGKTCNICGKPITDNYTRVVGFLTNTKNWSEVRREHDYKKRVWYRVDAEVKND